jgi:hypothetical protein
MRRFLCSLVVVAAACVVQPVFSGEAPDGGCRNASFTPEVHNLYGDAKAVLAKVEKLDRVLKDRRVWGFIVETDNGSAQVALFKKANKGEEVCTVYTFSSDSGCGDLRTKLDQAILANAGICCIGEQANSILTKELGEQLHSQDGVPAPVSVLAALRHTVQQQGDHYIRVTLLLLC